MIPFGFTLSPPPSIPEGFLSVLHLPVQTGVLTGFQGSLSSPALLPIPQPLQPDEQLPNSGRDSQEQSKEKNQNNLGSKQQLRGEPDGPRWVALQSTQFRE